MSIALRRSRWSEALTRWALKALRRYAAARRQRRGAHFTRVSDLSPHLRRDIGLGREWVE